MAVNATGEWLAFGCSSLGQLLVWEWQSESYILKQQGHYYDMNCLAYSPDGQIIATAGEDGKVGASYFLSIIVVMIADYLSVLIWCRSNSGTQLLVFVL